jgi:serine/threonine protein kinase
MAKAKIVQSAAEFLSVVEKSGLLNAPELESAKQICAGTDDPKTVARKLLSDGILTHWQANQLLAGFAGLTMGKYVLLDVLAKSELGRVYLAKSKSLNEKVALLAISTKNFADSKRVERFLNDTRRVSTLEHPNLVRVTELSSDNDRHLIVTELVSDDLQQRIDKNGPLDPKVAATYIQQAAKGLAHLHQNKILHLDLTPANLAITEHGMVKVKDAGLFHLRNLGGRATSESQPATQVLSFTSPEVKSGQEADGRADIYSLGGVFYFLLTGKAPITAGTDDQQLAQQESKVPVALSSIQPDVPDELARLCQQMLAASPSERPGTMDDIVAQLQSLSTSPVVVQPCEPPAAVGSEALQSFEVADEEQDPDAAAVAEDDANVDTEAIPDAELAGFKVKKKARETLAASDRGAQAISPEQLAKKQQLRMWLMIGGVAAALLILVTAGVIGLMSASTGEEVAQKTAPVALKAEPPPVTDPYGGGPPIVAVDAGLSTVAPSSALAGLAGTPATDAATPALPPGSAPSSDVAAAAPTTGAPTVAAPASAAVASPPAVTATPMPATAAPATEQKPASTPVPMPTDPPKPGESPEKKQEAKPEVKPETKPEAKPETQPAPPPTPPKKAAPPARMFEIAAAVELPRLPAPDGSAAEAPKKVLGRVNADPQAGCFISLLGGTTAMKGKTELGLRSAQGGTAPRDWEFIARETTDAETILATLSLRENELVFEWTPDGMKHATAPHLQNCALRIGVGQEKPYTVALRTPQSSTPLSLATLDKSPATFKFDIEGPPDPAAIRIEPKVTEIKMTMEAPSATDKNKADQWMYLGEGGAQSLLHVRVATTTTPKGVQVLLTPFLVLPQEKPQRLTPSLRKSLPVGALQEQRRLVENRIGELGKLPKDQKLAERDEMSVRKKLLDESLLKLQQFDEVLQKLATAQLQLRIYHDATDAQIDLVRSGP